MMTAYGEVDVAVEAMKRVLLIFFPKPVNLEKLELLIQRGINERKLKTENKQLHQRLDKSSVLMEFWESRLHWKKS